MLNKEEIISEIRFLKSIYSGNREDIIADISSDLMTRYVSMNLNECIVLIKETVE